MKTNTLNFARLTGIALLAMAILAGFAFVFAMNEVFVPADMNATYLNVLANTGLYQAMTWAFTVIFLLDILVSFSLCYWLSDHNPKMVKSMAVLRLLYSLILAVGIFHLFQSYYPEAADPYDSILRFQHYFSLGLIVFGVHLSLLGWILWKRMDIPKLFGALALFAGLCYTLIHFLIMSWPEFASYRQTIENGLALPMAAGELALALWLSIKGKRFSPMLSGSAHPAFYAT